jgi:hypothetical protein
MFELNANIVVVASAFTGALADYLNARRAGVPLVPALNGAAGTLVSLGILSVFYLLALNALRLRWDSLAGYGLGLAFGFAGVVVLLSFKSRRHRRGGQR